MRIVFELEPEDVARFRQAMERAARAAACAEDCDIIDAARQALDELPIASAPGFVRRQLCQVQRLIAMLEDEAWALPAEDRREVLQALAYFSDPEDLIPDHIEVIGLLDDAIMLALLMRRLDPMLPAYGEFCEFRRGLLGAHPGTEQRMQRARALADRRDALLARMRAEAASLAGAPDLS